MHNFVLHAPHNIPFVYLYAMSASHILLLPHTLLHYGWQMGYQLLHSSGISYIIYYTTQTFGNYVLTHIRKHAHVGI